MSDPLTEGTKSGEPGIKSLFGVWKDLDIEVSRKDIDELRREMWQTFPHDVIRDSTFAVMPEGPLPPPGWPGGRIYPGMFRGLIPDMSAEEIDHARREMWGSLPRDFPA